MCTQGKQEVLLVKSGKPARQTRRTLGERSACISRRKEIWEALHPDQPISLSFVGGTTRPTNGERRKDGRLKGPQHGQAFAADTSKVSGESKRDINRHIARAEALGPDVHKVVDGHVDGAPTHGSITEYSRSRTQTNAGERKPWWLFSETITVSETLAKRFPNGNAEVTPLPGASAVLAACYEHGPCTTRAQLGAGRNQLGADDGQSCGGPQFVRIGSGHANPQQMRVCPSQAPWKPLWIERMGMGGRTHA